MKTKILSLLGRLKNLLTAPLAVAGLEFSPTSLKYLLVKNQTISQASLRLPPGIITGAEIKDRKSLVAALKSLHLQIAPLKQPITVILNLPSALIFTQAFSVPLISSEHLEESIKLNLQMISPNRIEDSYYDWQEIKTNKDLGHVDLLGAFANRKNIDEFMAAAREANFNPIAVEFPGLALARLIRERWGGLEPEQNYLTIYIGGEGLNLIILKNGNVYFNHFLPWGQVVANKEITHFEQIKEWFTEEVRRVINFYLGRSGKSLNEVILISPIFNYEIVKLVSEKLGLKIRNLTIAELPKLPPNWFPVLGTGLRGLTPRSRDTDVSLTESNAQTGYYDERALVFIRAWRNIIVGVLVFIFASYLFIDTLFIKETGRLEAKIITEFSASSNENKKIVQEKINNFDLQLEFIEKAAGKEIIWSKLISRFNQLMAGEIVIDALTLDKNTARGSLLGQAKSKQAAIDFKNRLLSDSGFKNVNLPPAELKNEANNTASFKLSFEITE